MFFEATSIDIKPVFVKVSLLGNENPNALGLYEDIEGKYSLTPDETIDTKKEYYKKDHEGGKRIERKILVAVDQIKYLLDNPTDPQTTFLFANGGAPCLIKGSFEVNSKVLRNLGKK
ncbi:MAG: hypothetical protein J6Y02_12725 [Pseudobutyrivibrio sp.]|nr:hypothetical protein [Pseudobutyrivibrio sp.]